MNLKVLIAGAVSGFVSAVLVDIHAWSSGQGAYDWSKALKRWVAGAISGAAAGAGISVVQ